MRAEEETGLPERGDIVLLSECPLCASELRSPSCVRDTKLKGRLAEVIRDPYSHSSSSSSAGRPKQAEGKFGDLCADVYLLNPDGKGHPKDKSQAILRAVHLEALSLSRSAESFQESLEESLARRLNLTAATVEKRSSGGGRRRGTGRQGRQRTKEGTGGDGREREGDSKGEKRKEAETQNAKGKEWEDSAGRTAEETELKISRLTSAHSWRPPESGALVVFWDLESTGLDLQKDEVIQIGACCSLYYKGGFFGGGLGQAALGRKTGCDGTLVVTNGVKMSEASEGVAKTATERKCGDEMGGFQVLVKTEKRGVSDEIRKLTGISEEDLRTSGKSFPEALQLLGVWLESSRNAAAKMTAVFNARLEEDSERQKDEEAKKASEECCKPGWGEVSLPVVFVAHSGDEFDVPLFLANEQRRLGVAGGTFFRRFGVTAFVDSLPLARRVYARAKRRHTRLSLSNLFLQATGRKLEDAHQALADAQALRDVVQSAPFVSIWRSTIIGRPLSDFVGMPGPGPGPGSCPPRAETEEDAENRGKVETKFEGIHNEHEVPSARVLPSVTALSTDHQPP